MHRPAEPRAPAAGHPTRPGLRPLAPMVVPLALLVALGSSPAAGAPCRTSGPPSGAYTVTVCIDQPIGGSTLSGRETVRASVTVSGTSSGVRWVTFRLNGGYVLNDFASPYTFALPTAEWTDRARTLTAEVKLKNGFRSSRASVAVTFANGVSDVPPPPVTFTPRTGTEPPLGRPPVLAAVGDGADGSPKANEVSGMIDSWDPNLMWYLGDVYDNGTISEYLNWYGEDGAAWGRLRDVTNPILGNHEYRAPGPGADGHDRYWGSPPHHYAVDVGGWRLIGLDTTSGFDQLEPGTPQFDWLATELAAATGRCVLVFGHNPAVRAEGATEPEAMDSLWSLMANGGVEAYLSGDSHTYQRWLPLDADRAIDPDGLTHFVAGTGGHGVHAFEHQDVRRAAGFDRAPDGFGALRMELNLRGASFAYHRSDGAMLDWGSLPCRGTGPDAVPPTAPTGLSAEATAGGIDLRWEAGVDDVGVTGYRILRDGALLADARPETSYRDRDVTGGTTYRYEVVAVDGAGGESPPSEPAEATAEDSGPATAFEDDFETGTLEKWADVQRLVVQQEEVDQGLWAARATDAGGPGASAWAPLSPESLELTTTLRFKVVDRSTAANLVKLETGSGEGLARLFLTKAGKLAVRNVVVGRNFVSGAIPAGGAWHEAAIRLSVDGSSSETEVWLDGARKGALSKTTPLGTDPIGRLRLGNAGSGSTFDIAFDGVDVSPPAP